MLELWDQEEVIDVEEFKVYSSELWMTLAEYEKQLKTE
jgi:hypothetical protein